MKVGHGLTAMPHAVGRFNEINTTGPRNQAYQIKIQFANWDRSVHQFGKYVEEKN